jgi:hypothetical protein
MNIVPSNVAMGVAQTSLQAQQVARMRAARAQQDYRQTRAVRETAEIHLRALDENDQGHAGVHVAITDDLPNQPHPEATAPQTDKADRDEKTSPDQPPIVHVDVQA